MHIVPICKEVRPVSRGTKSKLSLQAGTTYLLNKATDVLALGCVLAALKPCTLIQAACQGEHLRRLPQLPDPVLAQGLQYPVLPCPAESALTLMHSTVSLSRLLDLLLLLLL